MIIGICRLHFLYVAPVLNINNKYRFKSIVLIPQVQTFSLEITIIIFKLYAFQLNFYLIYRFQ